MKEGIEMGFIENLGTLAMDERQRNEYYALKASPRPEDRARAKQMMGQKQSMIVEMAGSYLQGRATSALEKKKEELQDIKQLLSNEHQYLALDSDLIGKIKATCPENKQEKKDGDKDTGKERRNQSAYSATAAEFGDMTKDANEIEFDGPEY